MPARSHPCGRPRSWAPPRCSRRGANDSPTSSYGSARVGPTPQPASEVDRLHRRGLANDAKPRPNRAGGGRVRGPREPRWSPGARRAALDLAGPGDHRHQHARDGRDHSGARDPQAPGAPPHAGAHPDDRVRPRGESQRAGRRRDGLDRQALRSGPAAPGRRARAREGPDGMTHDATLEMFFEEAADLVGDSEAALLRLEQASSEPDPALVNRIFRNVHTLKGTSAMLGLDRLAGFAHSLEDVLVRMRKGGQAVTPTVVDTLLASVDVLRRLLERAREGSGGEPENLESVLATLRALSVGPAARGGGDGAGTILAGGGAGLFGRASDDGGHDPDP